jgi:hypothetical protein
MRKGREECYNGWANQGLAWLKLWEEEGVHTEKAWIIIQTCGACCAELDRKHKEKPTEILQSFIWEQSYLKKETSYERYEKSGYFKEKYRKN